MLPLCFEGFPRYVCPKTCCRLIGSSNLSIVCEKYVGLCVCDCVLQWVCTLSRVSPALCPGIGATFPAMEWMNKWMKNAK